jgi:hypothetical protein
LSDFSRLEDKLTKLRQRERVAGEGRRLRGSTPEALLASVVTEIDETILPRRLSFEVEGGVTVHLAVANRRLQALVSPVPNLKGVDTSLLADRPLPDAEDVGVGGVKDALLAAFDKAGSVAIQSARPEGDGFPSDVGVPSSILARAWSVTEGAGEVQESRDAILTRFLGEMGDDALAWLRIEGEDVTGQGGDPALVDALGEQAAVFLDGYFSKLESLYPGAPASTATLVGPMGQAGRAVLFVEAEGVSAFIIAKADSAASLAGKWQRLTAA